MTVNPPEGSTTWVIEYDDGSAAEGPVGKQYLYSLYWALTTLTTVGYGDITPSTDIERQYATSALLVGAMVFAYLIGEIGGLIATFDRQAVLVEEKMDAVKEYLQWREIPRDLSIRVRRCDPTVASTASDMEMAHDSPAARASPRWAWHAVVSLPARVHAHALSERT